MLGFIDGHRPRQPTRPSLERRIEEVELTRRMPQPAGTLTRWGSQQNVVAVCLDAQPNGSRLSCGAKLEGSQTEFYNTERGRVTRCREHGRRQLQALVRLRTTSHSSGPASSGARRSTHRRLPRADIVMPNGRLLGTRHAHRPSAPRGLSLDSAVGSKRTSPTDAGRDPGAEQAGVHKKTWCEESCAA